MAAVGILAVCTTPFTYSFAPADAADATAPRRRDRLHPIQSGRPAIAKFLGGVELLTGKRTDVVDDTSAEAHTQRERQSALAVRPPLAFGDFAVTAEALDDETRTLPPAVADRDAARALSAADDVAGERRAARRRRARHRRRASARRSQAALRAAADAVVAVPLPQQDGSLRVSSAMAHDCAACDVQVRIARHVQEVQTTDVDSTASVYVDYQFGHRANDGRSG